MRTLISTRTLLKQAWLPLARPAMQQAVIDERSCSHVRVPAEPDEGPQDALARSVVSQLSSS